MIDNKPNILLYSQTELYLLSLSSKIALCKENLNLMQAFVDAVWVACEMYQITSSKIANQIALGSLENNGNLVREHALKMLSAEQHPEFLEFEDLDKYLDLEIDAKANKLTHEYKNWLNRVNSRNLILFEQLTRETYCLYAAMLHKFAFALRKYHLGFREFDEQKIINAFNDKIANIHEEFHKSGMLENYPGSSII